MRDHILALAKLSNHAVFSTIPVADHQDTENSQEGENCSVRSSHTESVQSFYTIEGFCEASSVSKHTSGVIVSTKKCVQSLAVKTFIISCLHPPVSKKEPGKKEATVQAMSGLKSDHTDEHAQKPGSSTESLRPVTKLFILSP